jgi:hypothetical protein
MPFGVGMSCSRRSRLIASSSARDATAVGSVRLRVMIWKSAYLTLSVTVRPRHCELAQYCQTFSMIGSISSRIVSKTVRSSEKVFSAPTDLRMRLARTGRSSMPRAIQ